jgi:microcystin-dependent protein
VSFFYLGEVRLVGFWFAPKYWAQCNGQLMPIAQNTALFSLLGTTYGGNGQTNFALPDLRGRVPVHVGQGPGLGNYVLGEVLGAESTYLLSSQVPQVPHTHPFTQAGATVPNSKTPSGKAPAIAGSNFYGDPGVITMAGGSVGANSGAGASQPVPLFQPSLVMNWCIALQGVFPSQN